MLRINIAVCVSLSRGRALTIAAQYFQRDRGVFYRVKGRKATKKKNAIRYEACRDRAFDCWIVFTVCLPSEFWSSYSEPDNRRSCRQISLPDSFYLHGLIMRSSLDRLQNEGYNSFVSRVIARRCKCLANKQILEPIWNAPVENDWWFLEQEWLGLLPWWLVKHWFYIYLWIYSSSLMIMLTGYMYRTSTLNTRISFKLDSDIGRQRGVL